MKLQVLKDPNPVLLQKSEAIEKITTEVAQLVQDMFDTMIDENGLGLSAVQVGRPLKLITMYIDGKKVALVNPKLLSQSSQRQTYNEGCLSFPDRIIKVTRSSNVKISYRNLQNKMQYVNLIGLEATVFLHEWDHLLGKLFTAYED